MFEDMMNIIQESNPDIKIVGIGGGGNNAISRMIGAGLDGVEYIAVNTDIKSLKTVTDATQILIGEKLTHRLGTGANPKIGFEAARQCRDDIMESIGDADMVYLTASLGGGTGSGAILDIARAVKEKGILTVAVVTKPFAFEGKMKMIIAENAISELRQLADSIIVIPNEKLCVISENELELRHAFYLADQVLYEAVRSLVELITLTGIINLDFADVRTTLKDSGFTVIGSAEAEGENRARIATERAIASPLIETKFHNPSKILINITYENLTIKEMDEIGNIVNKWTSDNNSNIIGCVEKPGMGDKINVSIIATSFENDEIPKDEKQKNIKTETPFDKLKLNNYIKTDILYKTKEQEKKVELPKVAASNTFKSKAPTISVQEDSLDIPTFMRNTKTDKTN